ncbi:MAG: tetratricopeptide repeat protein, partial [Deltaproteobacteria bacterium]|nr:tetratricopeptide repeat protein [Deltaproteobacteria bacterium]
MPYSGADEGQGKAYYYYLQAQMEWKAGNLNGAVDQYKKALDYDPQSAPLMFELASALAQQEHFRDALYWARKSAQLDDSVSVHLLLGRIYTSLGQIGEAIGEYEQIIKSNPEDQESYLLLGMLYAKNKEYEMAVNTLKRLIEKNDEALMAYYYLGRVYSETRLWTEAEKYYLKALDINPYFEPALFDLAALYEAEREKDKV